MTTCLLWLLLTVAPLAQTGPTFPAWSPGVKTWDAIGLLSPESKAHIAELQKSLNNKHHVGLWVVLVDSQARYSKQPMAMEDFALSLAHQKIRPLAGNDDFILLLVCKEDRKSRIELGKNWNNEWNDGCDLITSEELVANFKMGSYDRGVVRAVEALSEMVNAKNDPTPLNHASRVSARWGAQLSPFTYLSAPFIVPTGLVGAILLCVALFWARHRSTLAIGGMTILTLAFFSAVMLWVLGAIAVLYVVVNADWSSGNRYSSWDSDSSSTWFSSSSDSSGSFFSSSDSSWSGGGSDWGGSGGGSTGSW